MARPWEREREREERDDRQGRRVSERGRGRARAGAGRVDGPRALLGQASAGGRGRLRVSGRALLDRAGEGEVGPSYGFVFLFQKYE
jgi:hypothetical protein